MCSGPKSSTVYSRGTSHSGRRVTASTAVKEEVGRWQAAFSLGAHGRVGCRIDGCARPSAALGSRRRVGGASPARRWRRLHGRKRAHLHVPFLDGCFEPGGATGTVALARKRRGRAKGATFAIKSMSKPQLMSHAQVAAAIAELEIMRRYGHHYERCNVTMSYAMPAAQ